MVSFWHWATHLLQQKPQTFSEKAVDLYHQFYDMMKHFFDSKIYAQFIDPMIKLLPLSISRYLSTGGFIALIALAMLCVFVLLPLTALLQYVPGFESTSTSKRPEVWNTHKYNNQKSTKFPYNEHKAYYDQFTPHHPLTNPHEDGTALFRSKFPYEELPESEVDQLYSPLRKPSTPKRLSSASPSASYNQPNHTPYIVHPVQQPPSSHRHQNQQRSLKSTLSTTATFANAAPIKIPLSSLKSSTRHNNFNSLNDDDGYDYEDQYIPEDDHNLRNRAWLERNGEFMETSGPDHDAELFHPKFTSISSSSTSSASLPMAPLKLTADGSNHSEVHKDFEPTIGDDDYDAFASHNTLVPEKLTEHVSFSPIIDVRTTGEPLAPGVINADLAQGNTVHPNKAFMATNNISSSNNQLRSRYKQTPSMINDNETSTQDQKRTIPQDVNQQHHQQQQRQQQLSHHDDSKMDDYEDENFFNNNVVHIAKNVASDAINNVATNTLSGVAPKVMSGASSPFFPGVATDHQVFRAVAKNILRNGAPDLMSPLARTRQEHHQEQQQYSETGIANSYYPLFNRLANRNQHQYE